MSLVDLKSCIGKLERVHVNLDTRKTRVCVVECLMGDTEDPPGDP